MTTFKNQSYLYIQLNAGIALGAATSVKIIYQKPGGTAGAWDADVISSTYLKHEFEDGDLDEAGTWKAQTYAVIDGRKTWGDIIHFNVKTPLLAVVT